MTRADPPSRERIVAGAADLIARRGLSAASIRETARHANAPLGSTYHYFPEGKAQLATEAVQYAAASVERHMRAAMDAGPAAGLAAYLKRWRDIVVGSGFRTGCPVLAVAVEEPPEDEFPPALRAAAAAFDRWERLFAESLEAHGADPEEARDLATLAVAAVEGTVAMCRAKQTAEPLDWVARRLEALVAAAVAH